MAGRIIAQLIVSGAQIFTRAFADAYRQAAAGAARHGNKGAAAQQAAQQAQQTTEKAVSGITLQEARQILNVKESASLEDIFKNYNHLFKVNDKSSGGSFYLQSKVVRARERLEVEFPPDEVKALQQRLKQQEEAAAKEAAAKEASKKE
eukprot:Colp12_sorted_trinity150504_noHs@13541